MKKPDESTKRATVWGTLIGAAIVSLLSSGVLSKFLGEDAKESAKAVVRGHDVSTAIYLDVLREALEKRLAEQDRRIDTPEHKLAATSADFRKSESPLARAFGLGQMLGRVPRGASGLSLICS